MNDEHHHPKVVDEAAFALAETVVSEAIGPLIEEAGMTTPETKGAFMSGMQVGIAIGTLSPLLIGDWVETTLHLWQEGMQAKAGDVYDPAAVDDIAANLVAHALVVARKKQRSDPVQQEALGEVVARLMPTKDRDDA